MAAWVGLGCAVLAARAEEAPPKPGAFAGRHFPEVRYRTPDKVQFMGFQYGDRPEEVVYLAFDMRQAPQDAPGQRTPPAMYDVMYVHTPWMPDFLTPKTLIGQPWRDRLPSGRLGREIAQFPSFKLSTTRQGATIDFTFNMTWQPGLRRPAGRVLMAMSGPKGRGRVEVDLGRLSAMAPEAPIRPIMLLDRPQLELRVLENGRTVGAALTLGSGRAVLPGGPGTFGAVQLEVRQGSRPAEKKTLRPDRLLFGENVELFSARLGSLPPDKTYTFVVTADLGPLGSAHAEQQVMVDRRSSRP